MVYEARRSDAVMPMRVLGFLPMQKPFQRGENNLRGYRGMCSKNVFE